MFYLLSFYKSGIIYFVEDTDKGRFFMRPTKRLSICLALCLAITVLLSVCLIGCNSLLTSTPQPTQKPQTPTSFVSLDVNPTIELILDQNNVVMSVAGANHDGKVLLFDEDGIVGTKFDVALANLTSLYIKYGYLTQDNATISVGVTSNGDKNNVFESAQESIQKSALLSNLSISLQENVDMVFESELSALKAQYPLDENIQNLDVTQFRLAQRVRQHGESVYDACSQSLESLLARANEAQSDSLAKFDADYPSVLEQAQYAADSACSLLKDSLYVGYYIEKGVLTNFEKVVASIEYTLAKASKLALQYYDTCLDVHALNEEYALTEQQAKRVANALNVEYNSLIEKTHVVVEDDIVIIDKNDFTSYVNTLYRNAGKDVADEIKSAYSSLSSLLDGALDKATDFDKIKDNLFLQATDFIDFDEISSLIEFLPSMDDVFPSLSDVIDAYLPDDSNLNGHDNIQDAIKELDAEIARLNAIITPTDEDDFDNYCEKHDLTNRISELRNGLKQTLEEIKSSTTKAMQAEKESRLVK